MELPDVRTTNYSVNLVLLLTVIRGTFFIVLFVCACVGGGDICRYINWAMD